jgi:hypothetical protein
MMGRYKSRDELEAEDLQGVPRMRDRVDEQHLDPAHVEDSFTNALAM